MSAENGKRTWQLNADGTGRALWTNSVVRWIARVLFAASTLGFGYLAQKPNSDLPGAWKVIGIVTAIAVALVVAAYEIVSTEVKDRVKDKLERQIESLRSQIEDAKDRLPEQLEEAKVEGARKFTTKVNGLLTEQIAVSDGGWRPSEALAYIRAVVKATSEMLDVDDCRACLFEYNGLTDDQQPKEGDYPELLPFDDGYSLNATTRAFRNDTAHGRAAISLVQNHDAVLVEDVRDSPDHVVAENIKGYETFVAVGVHWKGSELGMLTVDAKKKGQLTEHHKQLVMLLARWVAVGLYHRENSKLGQDEQASMIEDAWGPAPWDVPENEGNTPWLLPEDEEDPPWS